MPEESDPLLGETRIYPSRWYIVGVFALFGCVQSGLWSLYAPLDLAIQAAYGWAPSTFAMMTNWGNIAFILAIVPISWILEKKGLRSSVLICSTFSLVSVIIRLLSTYSPNAFTICSHVGSLLNGLSGTVVLSAPSVLSATWFPSSERTVATSISQMFAIFGNALSLMVGPRAVPDSGVNATDPSLTPEHVKERIRNDIFHYLIGITALNATLAASMWVYFPSKPKLPPSSSSSLPRVEFVSGIRQLVKNKTAWLCVFAYSVMIGIQSGWSGIQSLDFVYMGIHDREAGNIGLTATLFSCAFGLCSGFLADRLRRKYRPLIVLLLLLSSVNFIWFALIINKVIPVRSSLQVYVSIVLGTGTSIATLPLYFEYACELLYPVSEGEIGAFLSIGNNVLASLFCFLFFIPNLGYMWMNYLLVASTLLPLPALALIHESYSRSDADTNNERV